MDRLYGYFGKMLKVDLTNEEVKEVPLEKDVARKYIGGAGLSTRILYDEIEGSPDPLSPGNVLVFPCGPFNGTGIPWSNRYAAAARSPLTTFWGKGTSGGAFMPAVKRAGYDGLIFKGKAKKPVYLYVTDYSVELRDASHLWGLDSFETETEIRKDLKNPDIRVACIGQAGENMVSFAAIMNDMGRAVGRTGLGAVMGSKNLKAIAAYGEHDVEVANPEKLFKLIMGLIQYGKDAALGVIFGKNGTAFGGVSGPLAGSIMSTSHYWTISDVPKEKTRSVLKMAKDHRKMFKNTVHCEYCPTGCGADMELKSGKYSFSGPRWEYEAAASFGQECDIYDLNAVAKAADFCSKYGLDVISTGGVVAFAMMCRENGWLSKSDTDGLDLSFGNAGAMVEMVRRIAFREGFGSVLADGIKPAAQKIGHNSISVAVHGKGMPPGFGGDPRVAASSYLAWGLSPRGMCHIYGAMGLLPMGFHLDKERRMDSHSFKGGARGMIPSEDILWMFDSAAMCMFPFTFTPDLFADLLSAVTGWNIDAREVLQTGNRMVTMARLLNCRFGITKDDDVINPMKPVSGSGYFAPEKEEVLKAVEEYYHLRGWSKDGVPTRKTIEKLGIENVKESLPSVE